MKIQTYRCHLCNHPYADEAFTAPNGVRYDPISPQQNCVQNDTCPGQGSGGLCIPSRETEADIRKGDDNGVKRRLSLCVFLMDASGSMGDSTYDPNFPSTLGVEAHVNNSLCEKRNQMSKRELMSINVAEGIFTLQQSRSSSHIVVAVALYNDKTQFLFFEPILELIKRYATPQDLAKSLLTNIKDMIDVPPPPPKGIKFFLKKKEKPSDKTNINQVLQVAYDLVKQFCRGELKSLGKYEPYYRSELLHYDSDGVKLVPSITSRYHNMRILLYTDGQHETIQYGVLQNPFQKAEHPSPLIICYLGRESDDSPLLSSVTRCPRHGRPQYFTVCRPSDGANLDKLFIVNDALSGYCDACMPIKSVLPTPTEMYTDANGHGMGFGGICVPSGKTQASSQGRKTHE